jgi:hypothetical protein
LVLLSLRGFLSDEVDQKTKQSGNTDKREIAALPALARNDLVLLSLRGFLSDEVDQKTKQSDNAGKREIASPDKSGSQ